MEKEKKKSRYQRLHKQLEELLKKNGNFQSKLATITAVLYHKMDSYFWCGFYLLDEDRLIVNNYQGPVACQELAKDTGVCWAGINEKRSIVVDDVEKFPGHIACDSRSKSEIVVPLKNKNGEIIGILDVDSKSYNSFDKIDAEALEQILNLINN